MTGLLFVTFCADCQVVLTGCDLYGATNEVPRQRANAPGPAQER